METIAFYSYKGGVGRTLLVANTAQFLALCGRRVVALDLDFEAPGLHEKLATRETLKNAERGKLRGAVDLLKSIVGNEKLRRPISAYAVEISLPQSSEGSLMLMPAGSAPAPSYWAALDQLNQTLRQGGEGDGLAEAVLELQARIADEWSPDYLLIDSRTGITELGGLATSLLADRVVCLTTNSRESIKGTKVVAKALRDTPRLRSQKPLHLEFVVSRLDSHWRNKAKELSAELGEDVTVLPHDSRLARSEHTLVNDGDARSADDKDDEPSLLAATLEWIAATFKQEKKAANAAQKRMLAVNRAWHEMTRTYDRGNGGSWSRNAWPVSHLAERLKFDDKGSHREADIVAFDGPVEQSTPNIQMIVEYVEAEDREIVAKWWFQNTKCNVVILLSEQNSNRIFSRKNLYSGKPLYSDRWDIPLPEDFKSLEDPADASIGSLLESVRRGHDRYLDRIVTEWIHATHTTLHGGAPWRPEIAKKILETLAQVTDHKLATRVLWATSGGSMRFSRYSKEDDGSSARDHVRADLFTPLLWRLPVEASIELLHEAGHRGRPMGEASAHLALEKMARDLLGLIYDPDAFFRREGHRLLGQSNATSDSDDDQGIYAFSEQFKCTELSFEISDNWPDHWHGFEHGRFEKRHPRRGPSHLFGRLSERDFASQGWLGDFDLRQGQVKIYRPMIDALAERIGADSQNLASVILLQQTITGLAHVARDLDGQMTTVQPISASFDSAYSTTSTFATLMQFFTYRYLKNLQDSSLMKAFDAMSEKMSPSHRAWEHIKDMPLEEGRAWLVNIRRGTGGSAWSVRLSDCPNLE